MNSAEAGLFDKLLVKELKERIKSCKVEVDYSNRQRDDMECRSNRILILTCYLPEGEIELELDVPYSIYVNMTRKIVKKIKGEK